MIRIGIETRHAVELRTRRITADLQHIGIGPQSVRQLRLIGVRRFGNVRCIKGKVFTVMHVEGKQARARPR